MFHWARADTKETVQWLESIMPGWLFQVLVCVFCGCLAIILLYRVFQFCGWLFRGGKSRTTDEQATPTVNPPRRAPSDQKPAGCFGQAIAGLVGLVVMIYMVSLLFRHIPLRQQPNAKKPGTYVSVKADGHPVDPSEQLYLLYELRNGYHVMDGGARDPGSLVASLARQRHQAKSRLEQIRAKRLDPELISLYNDLAAAIDAVTEAWESSGCIERGAIAQAEAQLGNRSTSAGGVRRSNPLPARGGAAPETWQKTRYAAWQKRSTYLAGAQTSAAVLANRYGWSLAETGMVNLAKDFEAYEQTRVDQDLQAAVAWAQKARSQRPRDPIAVALHCSFAAREPAIPVERRVALAEQCHAATKLVPSGPDYDESRAEILLMAANILAEAALEEAKSVGSWVDATQRSPKAASHAHMASEWFGAAVRNLNPSLIDSSGEFRLNWAIALAVAGRPADGLEQAKALHAVRNDPLYAYVMTVLLSKAGAYDDSVQWLRHLLSSCPPEMMVELRSDPSLAPLRQARPAAWSELFRTK